MKDFEAFVRKPAPNGRFAEYISMVRRSESFGQYLVLDPGTLEQCFGYSDMLQAHRNAPLYRTAILDESLPACLGDDSHLIEPYPFFCRYFWIVDLGRVRYAPACHELREVMLHDLNSDLRGAAAETLGKIGDPKYTKDLIHVMKEDNKISRKAMFALGDMKDDSALSALRDMFEEARRRFDLADLAQNRDMFWEQAETIRDITDVMIKIGGKTGKFISNWARYEFRDWVRRPMKTGYELSKIGS